MSPDDLWNCLSTFTSLFEIIWCDCSELFESYLHLFTVVGERVQVFINVSMKVVPWKMLVGRRRPAPRGSPAGSPRGARGDALGKQRWLTRGNFYKLYLKGRIRYDTSFQTNRKRRIDRCSTLEHRVPMSRELTIFLHRILFQRWQPTPMQLMQS